MTEHVLKQALEALQRCQYELQGIASTQDVSEAIAALKRSLADMPTLKQGSAEPAVVVTDEDPESYDGMSDRISDLLPIGTKLYTAPKPCTVPKGWQLVPIEPTNKMIAAGAWGEFYEESSHTHLADDEDVIDTYKAMLSAAPKPEDGEKK